MCGIAGVFGRGDAATVEAMLATLVHRGPDDCFVVSGERFTLGTRRLSIVDLEGGRQPVANETATVWAAQNGELYNFEDVRRDLVDRGHRLHTRADTEILPHLWEEDGEALPERIDGMFAVSVWDDRHGVGLLARDRAGKKPLYTLEHDGALWFASEIKALLCVPGFRPVLDREALHHFLSFKHVPCPLTMFKGIRVVPPAHRLVVEPGRRPPRSERYWRADWSAGISVSEDEAVDRLIELLRRSVRRRLMGDVPVAFFLSGGIDSSLVTALAAEEAEGRLSTFTLTYAEASGHPGKDADRQWARWVADRYGTDHREDTLAFGAFPETIGPILRCFDQPFAGTVSTWYLAEVIGRHAKVAVSGDGADEIFGSYLSHRLAQPLAAHVRGALPGEHGAVGFTGPPELLERLWEADDWAWRAKLLTLSESEKSMLYTPDARRAVEAIQADSTERIRDAFSSLTASDPLNRVLEAEYLTLLPDDVLSFADRLSMAHSLEVRSPFLDTAVVEFVAGLPGSWKIRNGQTKWLLKQAAARFFPAEMVHRPKEGFVMPIARWLLDDLEDYVRDILSPSRLASHGLLEPQAVLSLIDTSYAGGGDHTVANKLLALVVFQEWFDLYRPAVE